MLNCEKTVLGIIIGVTATIFIKAAYEYGKYSAIHEIYKRGWTVVENNSEEKATKE